MYNILQAKLINSKTKIIINIVCEYFGKTKEELESKSRKRELVIPRQLAMYFIKNRTELRLKPIGRMFGGRDHSTVIHALRTVSDMNDTDYSFKKEFDIISDLVTGRLSVITKHEEELNETLNNGDHE